MITTNQIRNVLRVYGDQLKKRNTIIQDGLEPSQQAADLIDISIEARRKQILNQMSNKLILQITPKDHQQKAERQNSVDNMPAHSDKDEI